MKKFDEYVMYQYLIDFGIATEDEVNLVSCINGLNQETMKNILYARTGYRDFEQYNSEMGFDNFEDITNPSNCDECPYYLIGGCQIQCEIH